MARSDLTFVLAVIAIGMASFAILIVFIEEGNVRHVQIYLPEQIKQTIAFEENGHVRVDGVFGTGEADNPTLVTRSGNYAYVLTVVNRGNLPHMLYIDGLNIQTKFLQSGENDTITVIPKVPGIYHYYDRAGQMQLLGELRVVQVIPEDSFKK